MKHIDFSSISDKELRALEAEAWSGRLDYRDFPAAEYKFFDRVAELGYRHRNEKIPAELMKSDIKIARDIYLREAEHARRCAEAWKERQHNIIRSGTLKSEITKATDHEEKLRLALECIEIMTGEKGFAKRSIS